MRQYPHGHYIIPVLSKAIDILELLQSEGQALTVETLYRRTGISKTTVYRVLKTLVHRGYLVHTPEGGYRHVMRPRKLRFGFACQSSTMTFSEDVTRSLRDAAAAVGVDLIVLDNEYNAATAVRNAEAFIAQRVDLILEFNVEHQVAAVIGNKVAAAGIPLIAVDIPHPNGTYFGIDNYRAGLDAGEALALHARTVWRGKVDRVLGLDLPEAGLLVQGRILGAFEAVRLLLPHIPAKAYVTLDARGLRAVGHRVMSRFLDRHPEDRHFLVAAATDASALGAISAARQRRRTRHVCVVGQDCIAEAVEEMLRPDSPLVGTISHEAARYGPCLINLGLSLLKGETVPPYNYVTHRLVTPSSLRDTQSQ